MSERALVERTIRALRAMPDTHVVKNHGSIYSRSGEPDLYGCCLGACFVIELKAAHGVVTRAQILRLNQWHAAGARVGVARSVESAVSIATGKTPWEIHDL